MGRVVSHAGTRVPAIERTAAERAEARLAEASARAESWVADAAREAERIREDARAEAAREALTRASAIDAETRRMRADEEGALVELALRIGSELARDAILADGSVVRRLVAEALSKMPIAAEATIRLHPDDAVGFDDPRITTDPTLARGDVVVDSSIGRIDASFATRLDAIRSAIRGSTTRRT